MSECPQCGCPLTKQEAQIAALKDLIKRISMEMGSGSAKGRAIDLLPKKLTDEIQRIAEEQP